MSIHYGSANYLVTFTEPVSLQRLPLSVEAGIYVILLYDSRCRPRPYRVLYFGETETFSQPSFLLGHPKFKCWLTTSGGMHLLYIATCLLSGSHREERLRAVKELSEKYEAPCNKQQEYGVYDALTYLQRREEKRIVAMAQRGS